MTWISVKEYKPTTDLLAVVCNERGYMWYAKAHYDVRHDIWKLCDSTYRESIAIDVTHYIEIPPLPRD